MKKNISLFLTLLMASTLLVAAKPLTEKTKPVNKARPTNKVKPVDEVRPTEDEGAARKIVKPMKKKPQRRPPEVRAELERLRKKFENEKLLINDDYRKDLKMLKGRKHEALEELKAEYKKKRARLRKRD